MHFYYTHDFFLYFNVTKSFSKMNKGEQSVLSVSTHHSWVVVVRVHVGLKLVFPEDKPLPFLDRPVIRSSWSSEVVITTTALSLSSTIMSECPLKADTELLARLNSHNPLIPLPLPRQRNPSIIHAPKRTHGLTKEGQKVLYISALLL